MGGMKNYDNIFYICYDSFPLFMFFTHEYLQQDKGLKQD